MKKPVTNMNSLRDNLTDVFNRLRDGSIDPKLAVEMNNTAGKIISSAKAQIAYYSLRGETPNIEFLAAEPSETTTSK